MRVLHVIPGLDRKSGGPAIALHGLASAQRAAGLQVSVLSAYRKGDDPGARLAILSTYLGHINPVHTYWYLSASPELLKLAGDRLERHLGGDA